MIAPRRRLHCKMQRLRTLPLPELCAFWSADRARFKPLRSSEVAAQCGFDDDTALVRNVDVLRSRKSCSSHRWFSHVFARNVATVGHPGRASPARFRQPKQLCAVCFCRFLLLGGTYKSCCCPCRSQLSLVCALCVCVGGGKCSPLCRSDCTWMTWSGPRVEFHCLGSTQAQLRSEHCREFLANKLLKDTRLRFCSPKCDKLDLVVFQLSCNWHFRQTTADGVIAGCCES